MPPAASRRRYSSGTKRALLDVAAEHFASHGYAATSLDVVVAGAEVTKGALYHHFSGKQALFEAVLAREEDDAAGAIRAAVAAHDDPWAQAAAAVRVFLDTVQQPAYRRIVIQDGPAILGYERFREREERSSFALVHEVTEGVLRATTEEVAPAMVDTFSRILYGAMSSAGESVVDAADPEAATTRVELAMSMILAGLRAQAGEGFRLADPAAPQ